MPIHTDTRECLHYYYYYYYYYYYFIDAELGLIYLRVPTWCPFRLQFYGNGHRWMARQLTAAGIRFTLADPGLRVLSLKIGVTVPGCGKLSLS